MLLRNASAPPPAPPPFLPPCPRDTASGSPAVPFHPAASRRFGRQFGQELLEFLPAGFRADEEHAVMAENGGDLRRVFRLAQRAGGGDNSRPVVPEPNGAFGFARRSSGGGGLSGWGVGPGETLDE